MGVAGDLRPGGQQAVDPASNDIPAVRVLAGQLDLQGRAVTIDAMHARQETARSLPGDCGSDWIATALIGNQETTRKDLQEMIFEGCPAFETIDKGHGRIDRRKN